MVASTTDNKYDYQMRVPRLESHTSDFCYASIDACLFNMMFL